MNTHTKYKFIMNIVIHIFKTHLSVMSALVNRAKLTKKGFLLLAQKFESKSGWVSEFFKQLWTTYFYYHSKNIEQFIFVLGRKYYWVIYCIDFFIFVMQRDHGCIWVILYNEDENIFFGGKT